MANTTVVGRVAVRVYPDTSGFRRDLRRELATEPDETIKIDSELDSKGLLNDLRKTMRDLQRHAKQTIEVETELKGDLFDEKQARQMERFVSDLREKFKDTSKSVDKINDDLDRSPIRKIGDDALRLRREIHEASEAGFDLRKSLDFERSIMDQKDPFPWLKQAKKDGRALSTELRNLQGINASIQRENEKAARAEERLLKERMNASRKVAEDMKKQADARKRASADLLRDIQALEHHFLQVERSGRKLPKSLREARAELEHIKLERGKLGFDIDLDGIEKYKEQVRRLKDWTEDEFDNIEADLQPTVSELFYRRAQSRLAWLSRTRIVSLVPKVNRAAAASAATVLAALSGARLTGETLKNLRDLVKNIDKNLPKIALMATGFLNLTASILSTSANLFALSSSLAQIFPIALALPGLFAGVGLGITALIVPLLKINKELPELKKQWQATSKAMTKNFWAEAREPLREFANKLMPEFRRGMKDTATEMGRLVGTFGELFTKRMTTGPMRRMFDDLAESVGTAESGAAGMVEVITILGEKGAGLLPRLSGYFVDLTNKFANFLHKADDDGRLDFWIERAITQIKDLGRVLYEAGRLLGGLAKAAEIAGGTTLKTLGNTLEDIADVVNGEAFQQKLVNVFVAAEQAMRNISETAGPAVYNFFNTLADTLSTVLPVAGEIAGTLLRSLAGALSQVAVQRGIIDLFDGILVATQELAPAFTHLGDAFGVLMSLIGTLAKTFAPLLRVALSTVSDIFIELAPAIGETATALSEGLLEVFRELSPVLKELSKALAPVLVKLGKGLGKVLKDNAPIIAEIADVIGQALVDAIDRLADYLPQIVDDLLPQLLKVAKEIAPKIPEIVDGFLGLVDALVNTDLIPRLGELVGSLLELITSDVLPQLIESLPQVATSMADLASALTGITEAADSLDVFWGVLEILQGINSIIGLIDPAQIVIDIINGFREGLSGGDWGQIWYDFAMKPVQVIKDVLGIHSPSTVMAEIGRNVVQGFINGIGELTESAIAKAQELADRAVAIFDGAGDWLTARGNEFVSGFKSGIDERKQNAIDAAKAVSTAARNVYNTAKDWLTGPGRDFVAGLISGIGKKKSDARTAAGEIKSAVVDRFDGAIDWLKSAGSDVISGFVRGINAAKSRVRDTLSSLTSMLPSWKGPASRDRKILYGPGQLVMESFVDGLKSGFDDVRDFLSDVTREIERTEISAPEIDFSSSKTIKDATSRVQDDPRGPDDDDPPGASVVFNIKNYNPVAEPTSVTTTRTLREAQSLGVGR